MLLQIDHHSGQPIYRQVIDQIRRQVMAGQLREGEQLPSVRDLAAQLRVNPMTISKAYSLLEMEGLLDRRRGVGLFVAALARKGQPDQSGHAGGGPDQGGRDRRSAWHPRGQGAGHVDEALSEVRFQDAEART